MKSYITNGNLATISSNYKHDEKGWVKSYIDLQLLNYFKKNKFAFLFPNFDNNQITLQGALTWGDSGFSFVAKSTIHTNKDPIVTVSQHNNSDPLSIDSMLDITGILLSLANHKITTDISMQKKERALFRTPTLAAYKRNTKYSSKHIQNIEKHVKNQIFDRVFGDLLLSNLKNGLRCRG